MKTLLMPPDLRIDDLFVDHEGFAFWVDDMPASGPIDRETLDPGDKVLWFCGVWNGEEYAPAWHWLTVKSRRDTYAICTHPLHNDVGGTQVPYVDMAAASYERILADLRKKELAR